MDFIIHFSVPLVIGVLLWLISLCISNGNSKELINNLGKEHVVLRLPRLYLWVGVVGLVFDVFIYNFSYGNDEIWILLIWDTDCCLRQYGFLPTRGFGSFSGRTARWHPRSDLW